MDVFEPFSDYHVTFLTFYVYSDEGAVGTSEEELSCGEVDAPESQEYSSGAGTSGEQDLKGMLLRKYSGYLSSLRKEFLKKRKKGKLPKDARTTLMDWWNTHYRWPYPTVNSIHTHIYDLMGVILSLISMKSARARTHIYMISWVLSFL